jgi:hypothetical protein
MQKKPTTAVWHGNSMLQHRMYNTEENNTNITKGTKFNLKNNEPKQWNLDATN